MFVDYEDLENWLTKRGRGADMDAILQYLQQCVKEEAEILLAEELRVSGRQRSSKKLQSQCLKEAQEHYVEEVSELIDSGWSPSPWAVISYRRKPKAWAIAGAIKKQIERESNA